jgi:hypothetical protein
MTRTLSRALLQVPAATSRVPPVRGGVTAGTRDRAGHVPGFSAGRGVQRPCRDRPPRRQRAAGAGDRVRPACHGDRKDLAAERLPRSQEHGFRGRAGAVCERAQASGPPPGRVHGDRATRRRVELVPRRAHPDRAAGAILGGDPPANRLNGDSADSRRAARRVEELSVLDGRPAGAPTAVQERPGRVGGAGVDVRRRSAAPAGDAPGTWTNSQAGTSTNSHAGTSTNSHAGTSTNSHADAGPEPASATG